MSPSRHHRIAALFLSALLASPAVAQETDAPAQPENLSESLDPVLDTPLPDNLPKPTEAEASAPAAPTTNVTINLINRLVQKGILTQAEAAEMIQQAEADAAAAAEAQAAADISALPPEPSVEEEMSINYIPEVVRNQMRDQIQQELLAQAREEQWGANAAPDWTSKFRPFGDIRVRSENTFFPDGNDNTGAFPDFDAINTGDPFDTSGTQFSPQRNVDQDRYRSRLRARFGTDIMLGQGLNGGIRLATGGDNSPTSPNQTLGGSGGNFSKYAIWLDRAFMSYDAGPGDGEELIFYAGRFDNPFLSTEMHWDNDLGFDGVGVKGRVRLSDCLHTFFAGGYFPVYNTNFNFASNQPSKFDSTDKYLGGAQLGIEWKPLDDLTAKLAVAWYDYSRVQGKLSSPYIPLTPDDAGDTDNTRPSFAQHGNTYMALRNIDNSTSANDFGNEHQYQYYGLASDFENLTITGRIDYDGFDPFRLSFLGEATKNLAFDKSAINAVAVNNRGPSSTGIGAYEGGDTAWNVIFTLGNPALEKFGDWQAGVGYRYVESDAVVDAFADSNFGGGGTNVQGFTIGGFMALTDSLRAGLRWMSSDEIAGPPLSTDLLQIDLMARF